MRRTTVMLAVLAVIALNPAAVSAHELDHPAPLLEPGSPPSTALMSGGVDAQWSLEETLSTGNPHTDLDFFTQGNKMYAAVGTLGTGVNATGGGQTIVQLGNAGTVAPEVISTHPSAGCVSDPSAALSLQHDVEATPKGNVILNATNPYADTRDAQLLIDATDAPGRCHDGGGLVANLPAGGLEIIDITNVGDPVEIGLITHIGQSHTVNVDPKRPHIVFSVTSDSVSINAQGVRRNEIPGDSQRSRLDGFEIADISSCMDFPAGTSLQVKRDQCRPEVYRYRWPTKEIALGHTKKDHIYACHELEIYPDDRLTCGGGNAMMMFDMSGAFDDNETPGNYLDDRLRGAPLPCAVRASSSLAAFFTGAKVTDCVKGENNQALDVASWLQMSPVPQLDGVEYIGSVHHMGRGAQANNQSAYGSDQDVDFNHEAELTESGRFVLVTDERGGGVAPPGAACDPEGVNREGNGGIHAFDVSKLSTTHPASNTEAWEAYARTPTGEKAIYRAEVRIPAPSFCTAHVFQQIPGQNRIFMGWYSQGTQVVDFVEHEDGTIEFKEAGYFIPGGANTWVSHVFKYEEQPNGDVKYWGATGDVNLGLGRAAVDVYSVTLPPAPAPLVSNTPPPDPDPYQEPANPVAACAEVPAGSSVELASGGKVVVGSDGPDTISGTASRDILCGLKGDDAISGLGGNDVIVGGAGLDTITSGAGNDEVRSGPQADRVNSGRGNDMIHSAGGDDVARASGGKDTLRGKNGADRLFGGAGIDRLYGGKGKDLLRGGAGSDQCWQHLASATAKAC